MSGYRWEEGWGEEREDAQCGDNQARDNLHLASPRALFTPSVDLHRMGFDATSLMMSSEKNLAESDRFGSGEGRWDATGWKRWETVGR